MAFDSLFSSATPHFLPVLQEKILFLIRIHMLQFDFSGLGESDDDVITLASEVEDLRAASSWLAGLGFTRQMIHANGFGATAALLARPEHVRTAVLVAL